MLIFNLIRFSIIRAKMEMRFNVNKFDIDESYIITRNSLLQFCCFNIIPNPHNDIKKTSTRCTKNNKLNYVLEKIKIICKIKETKEFSAKEVKDLCEEDN